MINKYLKYKNKYLNLKNSMIGGSIHAFYDDVKYRNNLDWDTWKIKKNEENENELTILQNKDTILFKITYTNNKYEFVDIVDSKYNKQFDQINECEEYIDEIYILKTKNLIESAKLKAAYKAVNNYVKSDMKIGLGTGSTAYYAVQKIGYELKKEKLTNINCISTSIETACNAKKLDIPLTEYSTLDNLITIMSTLMPDVTIDGADAVDPKLNLIKGGGGAMVREKKIEEKSKQFICIVDDTKLYEKLGTCFPIPIEVTRDNYIDVITKLIEIKIQYKFEPYIRTGDMALAKVNQTNMDTIVKTNNGNYIIDLYFNSNIDNIKELKEKLDSLKIVGHGIFLNDMVTSVIVANKDGTCVELLKSSEELLKSSEELLKSCNELLNPFIYKKKSNIKAEIDTVLT